MCVHVAAEAAWPHNVHAVHIDCHNLKGSAAVFDELRVPTLWAGPLRVVRAKRLITAGRVAVGGDYGDSEGSRFLPPVSTLQLLQQALQVDLLAARPARTVVWVSRNPPDGGPLGMRAVTEPMYVMYRCLAAALGHKTYQIRLPPNTFNGPVYIGEGMMDALERAVTHALQ